MEVFSTSSNLKNVSYANTQHRDVSQPRYFGVGNEYKTNRLRAPRRDYQAIITKSNLNISGRCMISVDPSSTNNGIRIRLLFVKLSRAPNSVLIDMILVAILT